MRKKGHDFMDLKYLKYGPRCHVVRHRAASREVFWLQEGKRMRCGDGNEVWVVNLYPFGKLCKSQKLCLISFEVLLSIDFLTFHSPLLSRGFQICLGGSRGF